MRGICISGWSLQTRLYKCDNFEIQKLSRKSTLSLLDCTLVIVCDLKFEQRDSKYRLITVRNFAAASAYKCITLTLFNTIAARKKNIEHNRM